MFDSELGELTGAGPDAAGMDCMGECRLQGQGSQCTAYFSPKFGHEGGSGGKGTSFSMYPISS